MTDVPKSFDNDKKDTFKQMMRQRIIDAASGKDTSSQNYTPLIAAIDKEDIVVDIDKDNNITVKLSPPGTTDDQIVLALLCEMSAELIEEIS